MAVMAEELGKILAVPSMRRTYNIEVSARFVDEKTIVWRDCEDYSNLNITSWTPKTGSELN